MPLELQLIRANEFVRVDAEKHLDFEATRRVLQTLVEGCRKRGVDRALVDLRALPVLSKPHFTVTEIAALISTFREAGFSRQQRLAVLYQHDVYGIIRNFAFIGRMRGLQVEAFAEFESAVSWLSEDQEHSAERREGGDPITITKPQSAVKKVPLELASGKSRHSSGRPARRVVERRHAN